MNHDFVQLIGALTTAAGFLIFIYTALTASINVPSIIVFFVGVALLFLSRYLAKKDLESRRKKSRYLSSLDKKSDDK